MKTFIKEEVFYALENRMRHESNIQAFIPEIDFIMFLILKLSKN